MDKTVRIKNLNDNENDFAFWKNVSHTERLAQLEKIRQEFNKWKYGAEQRFQRVYTIIERS